MQNPAWIRLIKQNHTIEKKQKKTFKSSQNLPSFLTTNVIKGIRHQKIIIFNHFNFKFIYCFHHSYFIPNFRNRISMQPMRSCVKGGRGGGWGSLQSLCFVFVFVVGQSK